MRFRIIEELLSGFSSSLLGKKINAEDNLNHKRTGLTKISKLKHEYFMHCGWNERREKRRGAYVDSRQSYI